MFWSWLFYYTHRKRAKKRIRIIVEPTFVSSFLIHFESYSVAIIQHCFFFCNYIGAHFWIFVFALSKKVFKDENFRFFLNSTLACSSKTNSVGRIKLARFLSSAQLQLHPQHSSIPSSDSKRRANYSFI